MSMFKNKVEDKWGIVIIGVSHQSHFGGLRVYVG